MQGQESDGHPISQEDRSPPIKTYRKKKEETVGKGGKGNKSDAVLRGPAARRRIITKASLSHMAQLEHLQEGASNYF